MYVPHTPTCESALKINRENRKANLGLTSEFDYLFGIVTSGTEWHFLLYTTRGVFCRSQEPLCIRITKFALDEVSEAGKLLNTNVKDVIIGVVGSWVVKGQGRGSGKRAGSKKRNVLQQSLEDSNCVYRYQCCPRCRVSQSLGPSGFPPLLSINL